MLATKSASPFRSSLLIVHGVSIRKSTDQREPLVLVQEAEVGSMVRPVTGVLRRVHNLSFRLVTVVAPVSLALRGTMNCVLSKVAATAPELAPANGRFPALPVSMLVFINHVTRESKPDLIVSTLVSVTLFAEILTIFA